MGHYASEMMCDRCGFTRCQCALLPPPPNTNWIVDNDYSVIQVCDFDVKYARVQTKYGPIDGMPMARRMGRTEFETKQGAEAHAKDLAVKALRDMEAEVKALKKRIKQLP